jgi:hypothetical protein
MIFSRNSLLHQKRSLKVNMVKKKIFGRRREKRTSTDDFLSSVMWILEYHHESLSSLLKLDLNSLPFTYREIHVITQETCFSFERWCILLPPETFEWPTTTDKKNVKRFSGSPRGSVLAQKTSAAKRLSITLQRSRDPKTISFSFYFSMFFF